MSDIALILDPASGLGDFEIAENDFETDDGLETAILLSLFTNRRAEDTDELPEGVTDRRGYWADAHPAVEGDKLGSRLWLLERATQSQTNLDRAEEYGREALQWLLDDKVADEFEFVAEFPKRGSIYIAVTVFRPKRDPVKFRFNHTWTAQAAKRP